MINLGRRKDVTDTGYLMCGIGKLSFNGVSKISIRFLMECDGQKVSVPPPLPGLPSCGYNNGITKVCICDLFGRR
jgi:hypothetical protein